MILMSINSIIIPVVSDSRRILIRSSKVIFLYAIDSKRAYTTAIQDASVAVNTPAMILQHILLYNRDGIASRIILNVSLKGGLLTYITSLCNNIGYNHTSQSPRIPGM